MSLLHALGPVQTWLGQELEKCGIDAMIYTRYVLSLLLHDSYDYDLQEQENDIFLGWEKGAPRKWGKSKKRCSDLTLEEMKKQAAVQCLRSASDEFPVLNTNVQEMNRSQEKQTWWEKALYSPLFPASECEECYTNAKGENGIEEYPDVKEIPSNEERLLDFNRVSSVCEARCTGERGSGAKPNGLRRKTCTSTSASASSGDSGSEGGGEWVGPRQEGLFSRTHL
ncbi:uncharacterized protein KIAA0232 homolog isoform X5 [Sciurus carolinensis]|uniref:uncharacterized protein KIAA0232 homolog isoform X5 n=1 Tax=Sciurus carolinensis TaxID=30640 RepID=UPI001FB41187|nr:uncharacterized protein KIAA0232 homolog isoform X5 [Sciurus carolinensis]